MNYSSRAKVILFCGLLALSASVLTGCRNSSGTSAPAATGGGSSTSSGSGSTSTTTATGVITLSLSSSSISVGADATATANLKDAAGNALTGVVVTFTTDATYGVLTPSFGTALTDANGDASVKLAAADLAAAGASTITATAEVGSNIYEVSRGYTVGTASVTVTAPVFGANPLSAFGSTGVSVTVTNGAAPVPNQVVTFSSPCATSARAALSSSATTDGLGVARASYQDLGCGAIDRVTATVSGLASSAADLTIVAASVGSIQYVSASPIFLTLKGTGGVGRRETSVVKFKVVDGVSNPLGGKNVNFALSTSVGGLALLNPSAISDAVTGEVQVIVAAGTVATPVRVSATTTGAGGASLTTLSDELTVSVGLPDQNSIDLAAATRNIEGLAYSGVTTLITVRLGDVFNNPVPDGTAVNFITSGGMIGTKDGEVTGACLTVRSACEMLLTSQEPRPASGRVTVVAYAVGEESFVDANGNGMADPGEFTNVGEVFLDANQNGTKDANEAAIDFNGDGTYSDAADDPSYNGSMCATACSARKTAHVWKSTEIVFSGSTANITLSGPPDLGGPAEGGSSFKYAVQVQDDNGNPMPADTTIVVSSTNGTVTNGTYKVRNTATPVSGPQFEFDLKNDASAGVDPTPVGVIKVVVTTPNGRVTEFSRAVTN